MEISGPKGGAQRAQDNLDDGLNNNIWKFDSINFSNLELLFSMSELQAVNQQIHDLINDCLSQGLLNDQFVQLMQLQVRGHALNKMVD